jgi:acetoin utilization deacetylase AcuC-like enzyme
VASRRTGLVFDERCFGHRNPPGGPAWLAVPPFERPERLAATFRALEGAGVLRRLERLPARSAPRAALELVHDASHVERVLAEPRETVQLDHEAWIGPGSATAALLAVGGLLEAVAAVVAGEVDNAFVLGRPPGHHAEAARPMGFCLLNATAVAARWAQLARGAARVAILDWDVHHGNGTEEVFLADGSVLCVSLHQEGLYPPDTGGIEVRGAGPGAGANVNVPLPPGTGDHGYLHAFERVVEPLVREFSPDLLLIAAGQDASATDPLGRMSLTVPGYRALCDRTVDLAQELCGGRVVAVLEGGYSLQHVPLANLAVLEGLAGLPATFATDPVGVDVPAGLRDVERAAVEAAAIAHGSVPR